MTGENRNNILFVTDIIRQVFGINSPIYVPWGKSVPYQADEYTDIRFLPEDSDESDIISGLGTPVMGTITFDGGEYNMYDKRTGKVVKGRYGEETLPYSCIVEFSRDANVTKTNVLGSSGTVKELFGLGDWKITIRGIALNNGNKTGISASQQIESLVKWSDICDAIGVTGSIFRTKGIYSMVIENISIHPVVARWNAIPFQIDAVSDEPIELYLL